MKKAYNTRRVPRAKIAERSDRDLLLTVWQAWRTDAWNQRPCRQFSQAAIRRLECCQPHFRTFAALIDRDVVNDHDTRSFRLDALRRRFLAGLSPLDDLPATEEAETPMALAAA